MIAIVKGFTFGVLFFSLMGNRLFHISILLGPHFRFLRAFFDMKVILLWWVFLMVHWLNFSFKVLSFFQQMTAVSFLLLWGFEIFTAFLIVNSLSFPMVLSLKLLWQSFDLILLLVDLLSSGSSKSILLMHFVKDWIVYRFHQPSSPGFLCFLSESLRDFLLDMLPDLFLMSYKPISCRS